MPHYRDGTEAKVGDHVIGKDWQGEEIVGQVQAVHASNQSCNMTVAYLKPMPVAHHGTFTTLEFDKVRAPDDAR